MKKKALAIVLIAVLMCSITITAFAVGLLKPTMQITVQGGVYTIEITGLTRSQSKDLEKIINNYLADLEKDDYDEDDSEDEYDEPLAIVYLVRNNKLYHIENGEETYIDTVCAGEIGVDEYNNVVYINESYNARYIYNTNDSPTKTKSITSSAKNLEVSGNVVTGVDYASGRYTKTTSSFINDAGNEIPIVIYEQAGSQLRVRKLGEYIRITSSISTKADNPIAVTEEGSIVYVTTSGYVYEIEDVEYLTKIKSTTPTRLSIKNIADIEIDNGTATEYVYSNGNKTEIK